MKTPRVPILPIAITLLAAFADAQQFRPAAKLDPTPVGSNAVVGQSVAISGDRMVVGALNQGVVYAYQRTASGWVLDQAILPTPGAGEQFGASLALEGDRLVVGRPLEDLGSYNTGAVYVFERFASGWIETAQLIASDGAGLDNFGTSVSLSGDRILVGSKYDDDVGVSSGSAYVFERGPGGWQETAKLVALDSAQGDLAGFAVAIDGDVAAVGAWARQAQFVFGGGIFVFERIGTSWVQTATLTSSDITTNHYFGVSLAIEGSRIVGCATGVNPGAYVFERGASGWAQTAKLNATGPQYGCSVSLDAGRILVGAQNNAAIFPTPPITGTAHLYTQASSGSWILERTLFPRDVTRAFGWSVSLSGTRIAIGARSDGDGDGAAYVYQSGP